MGCFLKGLVRNHDAEEASHEEEDQTDPLQDHGTP
jgi:hypothetical protein